MNNMLWKDYLMPLILLGVAILSMVIGLIVIGTFFQENLTVGKDIFSGNGFKIIGSNVGLMLQSGPMQLRIGLIFTVILTPIFLLIAIIWAIYTYWIQRF